MDFGSLDPYYRDVRFIIGTSSSNMVVATDPANLFLDVAYSNVIAGSAFTNISIDTGGTNINFTELTGSGETRPENIALLPVIRY
jgi:hypothetical protein